MGDRRTTKTSLTGRGKNMMMINTRNIPEYHWPQLFADCREGENKHHINICPISGGPAY